MADTVEFTPGCSLVTRSTGGIEYITGWTLDPEGTSTHVRMCMQYHGPMPVPGSIAEQVIVRMNEREELMPETLKVRFEP